MNQNKAFAGGFYGFLLVAFVVLTVILSQSGLVSRATFLPYLSAAIAIPLLGFKFLRAVSPRIQQWLRNLKLRVGLDSEHEIAEQFDRAELFTLGWLILFVVIVYVFGLVTGMFVSVFGFIAYQEREYLRAAVIAFVVTGLVYLTLPLLFNETLWAGLLSSL
jgi:cytochrome b subunit of formate dehydrogenase